MPRFAVSGRLVKIKQTSPLRMVCCLCLLSIVSIVKAQDRSIISISVDATEASRRLLHSRMVFPAKSGPLTLLYPKWLPGEHGPTGPVTDTAGLRFSAAGKPLTWTRDGENMYAYTVNVPAGASSVEVEMDFLLPTDKNGFTSAASSTEKLAVINWNELLLYPQGAKSDSLTYRADIRLPNGWKHGGALPVQTQSSDSLQFQPVSLTTLVDSPLLTGVYFKQFDLTPNSAPAHRLSVISDSPAAMEFTEPTLTGLKNLVAETGKLFGARHYRQYNWLLTLSDHVSSFGLEHHESSDDRTAENTLATESGRDNLAGLLAHEYVHSWNGKFRRPAGLATGDYHTPMKGELLWVYEGLTNHLGDLLPVRCGLSKPEHYRELLAATAAMLDHQAGRQWRPLIDTTVAAQLLYRASSGWGAWRRSVDFYPEGDLIWLEVDTILRRESKGQKSLDDFCRAFYGGEGGKPEVKPYTFDDVVHTLHSVVAYDWRKHLNARLTSTDAHAPLGGIENSGWKLVYTEEPNSTMQGDDQKGADHSFSLGLNVGEESTIGDVIPGLPAAKAGIGPGMKLIAVNGRKYTPERLQQAIKESKNSDSTLELLIENTDYYRTFRLDYRGGLRYPHLVRDEAKPDMLADILKPTATP